MRLGTILGVGALVSVLLGRMSVPMSAQAGGATAATGPVPKALVDAGEYGENLYDAAKANDWTLAGERFTALKQSFKQLNPETGAPAQAEDRLERTLAALSLSVARRQRRVTMEEANQVTLDVANMTASYALKVPVQVTRLDFYGRELEIWAGAREPSRLRLAAQGMRHEWDAVRPSVEERRPAEARKFAALVTQVERAKAAAEYRRLAEPVLQEVDNLEKVFER